MNAGRMFKISGKKNEKSSEKLSSGYRINRAADDAAGLSISEKMRWQIRGMNRASNNAQDGISLIQTAEGALGEIHSMLHRANELAIQAANGTLTEADRAAVDKEVQQLKKEIDDTSRKALYNGMPVFPDDGYLSGSPNTIATHQYQMNIDVQNGVPAVNLQKAGQPGTQSGIGRRCYGRRNRSDGIVFACGYFRCVSCFRRPGECCFDGYPGRSRLD